MVKVYPIYLGNSADHESFLSHNFIVYTKHWQMLVVNLILFSKY